MEGTIGVGSIITSAEVVELPGCSPRLVMTANNLDETEGYAWFEFSQDSQTVKEIKLGVIRGGTVTHCNFRVFDLQPPFCEGTL